MHSLSAPLAKPGWMRELIAIWGYAQRNYYLTKRYFMWEVVWLVYSTMNALTIGFIGVGLGGSPEATARTTQLVGMGIYAIVYGMARVIVMLVAISFFFDLSLGSANYMGAAGILAICSISLVGFGMVAAVMPLLSPEKGQQVTSIVTAVLLLISGIYYSVEVLPGWMQPLANISPVYYALNGIRNTLLEGASFGSQWDNIWPLLIMGLIFPPLGLWLFQRGEHFAKRTGRLKRAG